MSKDEKNLEKNNDNNMKHTICKIFNYIDKYRALLFLVIILLLISCASMVAGAYFLKPIINNYIIPRDFNGLLKILILLGGIYVLGALSTYGYSRIMIHISQNTIKDIRKDLFNKMQELPLKYFDSNTNGDLMSLYTNDIDNIGEAINNSLANIIYCLITFFGVIIMMLVLSPLLTLVTFIFLVIMVFIIQRIGAKSQHYFAMQQENIGKLNGFIEEMIEGQNVIKVFCSENKTINEFKIYNEALRASSTSAQTYAGMIIPAFSNISHINYAVTCCVGGVMAIYGKIDIGSLLAFIQYVRQVADPLLEVADHINVILAAFAGAERIFKVLDEESEVDNGRVTLVEGDTYKECEIDDNKDNTFIESGSWTRELGAWMLDNKKDRSCMKLLRGAVEFKDVVFGYNKEKTILNNISLEVKPGQKIAIVGTTGAGKTTIINLINRFYEVNYGVITYDGIDIREIKKDDLRKSIGIILQDTHLFTGTIADNIRYGNSKITDEEVIEAAKLANADTFIKHLPYGYETVITRDGESLSYGQKQLLSIARTSILNPPVLIMDEATSSIDTRTEKLISEAMDKLMEKRTVFVIAHRISTIRNADVIIVLEHGKIIEKGNHEDLLAQYGTYSKLYKGSFQYS